MFTIAVCDDDMQERMQEVQIVKNIFSQKELEAGIEEFQTGQHFLDVLHRVPYDIVLLDIQMGEVSGFTLAEELYKITGGENIIFVSSMENLVFESIHFRPFRFVRKSHLEEELTEAVESWIQQNTKTECLEFDETGGVTTILPQQEIIYIEVQSHHLYVHTQKEVLKVLLREALSMPLHNVLNHGLKSLFPSASDKLFQSLLSVCPAGLLRFCPRSYADSSY